VSTAAAVAVIDGGAVDRADATVNVVIVVTSVNVVSIDCFVVSNATTNLINSTAI
jgi:hypothetical protein